MDAPRELILAGEAFRHGLAEYLHVGVTETVALGYLYSDGSLGQTELAEHLGINTSSMTNLVDRMEAKGIAERSVDSNDRRRSVVSLTERGWAIVSESRRWVRRAMDDLQIDLETFAAVLRQVAQALHDETLKLTLATERGTPTTTSQGRPRAGQRTPRGLN
jgi:DNA-binding MarR family transcriptional regulator